MNLEKMEKNLHKIKAEIKSKCGLKYAADLHIIDETIKLKNACKKFKLKFRQAQKLEKQRNQLSEWIEFYEEGWGMSKLHKRTGAKKEARKWIGVADEMLDDFHIFYMITRLIIPVLTVFAIPLIASLISLISRGLW